VWHEPAEGAVAPAGACTSQAFGRRLGRQGRGGSKIYIWSPDVSDRARSAADAEALRVTGPERESTVTGPAGGAGRHRRHQQPGRGHVVKLRYTEAEYADLAAAARRSGLTPSGYAAEAALAAARGSEPPRAEPWREALAEVIDARAQVRRFAGNVNQAVRALNATGEAPDWLDRAVAMTTRAVEQLDAAATTLTRRLR